MQPEEGAEPSTFGDGVDAVQAGGWVEYHVACGQFDGFAAVGVFDDEFSAFVFVRVGEEERAGEVGADLFLAAGDDSDGSIDVGAEGLAAGVAVEHGRQDVEGQGGGEEDWISAEGPEDEISDLLGDGVLGEELLVVFDAGSLVACGGLAVYPVRGFEKLSRLGGLFVSEYVWNV